MHPCSSTGASTCSRAGKCSSAQPRRRGRSWRRSCPRSRAARRTPCRGSPSPLVRLDGRGAGRALGRVPEIDAHELDHADCFIVIDAPENTREGSDISPERLMLRRARRTGRTPSRSSPARSPGSAASSRRRRSRRTPAWASGRTRTSSTAPCSSTGRRSAERMREIAARFDAAGEVRITGDGTDLTFSLEGRYGHVDAIGANMPGGEVFYSPVEDSARGTVAFSEYPACYGGRAIENVRLRFEGGRAVDASASTRRGLPAEDARHRRRRPRARRVRHRLQPGHPAAHAEHALRREDRGHDPSRPGQRLPVPRRHERQRRPLGHGQGPPRRRHDRARRRGRAARRERG